MRGKKEKNQRRNERRAREMRGDKKDSQRRVFGEKKKGMREKKKKKRIREGMVEGRKDKQIMKTRKTRVSEEEIN